MKALLLSARHRWNRANCSICGKDSVCAPILIPAQNYGNFVVTTDTRMSLCVRCLREAIRVATSGRKAVR
jgi:hypothetical protein